MLDLLESLIAAAKNEGPAAGLLATDSAGQIAV